MSALLLVLVPAPAAGAVVIHEIMYHPASEEDTEEFIELRNVGDAAVNLSGWRFDDGIEFTFASVLVPPGGYLVVAANRTAFRARYPDVTAVVGDWRGVLSNWGERIRLRDAGGVIVNEVRYADEGDWGERVEGALDHGHRGWTWQSAADGEGSSLELIDPSLPNDVGQNWASSQVPGGTPGRANSVAGTVVPPLISEVQHWPHVPGSIDAVTITARVVAGSVVGNPSVTLHYRQDEPVPGPVLSVAMADDGLRGDGAAGDGIYGALLPPMPAGTIVEFYLKAENDQGGARVWPAPVRLADGTRAQLANLLYQVDDEARVGGLPMYRLILTQAEQAELGRIGAGPPDCLSDAQFNATFISEDGAGAELCYLVGVRHRGHGSRGLQPNNYRVNLRSDQPWKEMRALNLNGQYSYLQHLASVFCRQAGLPSPSSHAARVRLNGMDPTARGPIHLTYGCYAANEVLNGDFVDRCFPRDDAGNLYRGIATDIGSQEADFRYLGDDPDLYRPVYFKQTNEGEDDWTDLIRLCRALSGLEEGPYGAAVEGAIHVDEWLDYFAVMVIVDNRETGLYTGFGDDFALYAGRQDKRFHLIPHDLDTLLGQGNVPGMTNAPLFDATVIPALARLLESPEFAPRYYAAVKRQLATTFSAQQFGVLADHALGSYVPLAVLNHLKRFLADRAACIHGMIPSRLTVECGAPKVGPLYHAPSSILALGGEANVIETRHVRVNGRAADWSAWQGQWSIADVSLRPGVNRIAVEALNARGEGIGYEALEVWREASPAVIEPGVLAEDAAWTVDGGPYLVPGKVSVPLGRQLSIQAGTTVLFAAGAGLRIEGELIAEGTAAEPVYLIGEPASGGRWAGLTFDGHSARGRLAHCILGGTAEDVPVILAREASLAIEGCAWWEVSNTVLELRRASVTVRVSTFPALFGQPAVSGYGFPADGGVVFDGNHFAASAGDAAVVEFTGPGGRRPGRILEFRDNRFAGGEGVGIRLDGIDAHAEGNVFQAFRNGRSSDRDGVGLEAANGAGVVLARNVFLENDIAVRAYAGAHVSLEHNTLVDSTVAALYLGHPVLGFFPAGDVLLEGGILRGNRADILPIPASDASASLWAARCLLSQPATFPGEDLRVADPRFVQAGVDFTLRPDSPARGAGWGGLDLGATAPPGAALMRLGQGPTAGAEAQYAVYGPGVRSYRYRLDGGPMSSELGLDQVIALGTLSDGPHTLEVEGRNSAGTWMPVSEKGGIQRWVVQAQAGAVIINELLAVNRSVSVGTGRFPDLVELYNPGGRPVDLSGMSLTDDPVQPRRYVFPLSSVLGAGEYLVAYADSRAEPPGHHLGFALNGEGEALFLFDAPAQGGGLLDWVSFGLQLADRSIGRLPGGDWGLTLPSFGGPNIACPLGDPGALRLNEWLTVGRDWVNNDFVELYNPDPLPVALGGWYLSDDPLDDPLKHRIAPLSFIEGRGFVAFEADGDPSQGADHLSFRLASHGGMIRLADSRGAEIDQILYGPQTANVSEGRSPDGSRRIEPLTAVTPGSPNPAPEYRIDAETLPLLALDSRWRLHEQGTDLGEAWRAFHYDDSRAPWESGNGLFYAGVFNLPGPLNTPLRIVGPSQRTYYFRTPFNYGGDASGATLELRHVIDDGAIVYLNEVELYRYNMPDGPVPFDGYARSTIGTPVLFGPVVLPATTLRRGANLLAVEVHQSGPDSSDVVFGLALEATVTVTNQLIPDPGSPPLVEIAGLWLSQPTVWSPDQGEIHLRRDVIVPEGLTLVITAGTVVRLAPGVSLRALGGSILALGTAEKPVRLLPLEEALSWGECSVTGDGARLRLRHTEMASGRVRVFNGALGHIEDCYLHDYLAEGNPMIESENSPFLGIYRSHIARFSELDLTSTPIWIEDCLIEFFYADAIDLDLSPPSGVVRRTIIRHGLGSNTDGIDFGSGSSGTVEHCLIYDIPDKAVSVGERSQDVAVCQNVIYRAGMGVGVKEFATARVWQNTIVDCDYGLNFFEKDSGQGGGQGAAWNNILWGNRNSVAVGDNSSLELAYCILDAPWPEPAEGILLEDPRFREPLDRDYELLPGSPALGRGLAGSDIGADWPPAGLPPRPMDLLALPFGGASHWLTWTDHSDQELGFLVERAARDEPWREILRLPPNRMQFLETDLIPGQTYQYRVSTLGRWGHVAASDVLAILPGMDRDGDGMPDDWERLHGLDPNSDLDAELDGDGDGHSNRVEFVLGTDPWDADSALTLEWVCRAGQPPALRFLAQPGRRYALQRSWQAESGLWSTFQLIPAQSVAAWLEVAMPPTEAAAVFYRLLAAIGPFADTP